MSRNFELLQRAGRERDIIEPAAPIVQIKSGMPRLPLRAPAQTQVEKLVERLFLNANGMAPHVVVFTSMNDKDRCGLICTHISDTLATRLAGTVCLVDANLHCPSVHQHCKSDNVSGLTALLQEPAKDLLGAVRPVCDGTVSLLPTGPTDVNVEQLLRSESLRLRMIELRQKFGHVLIVAPPVHQYDDALLFGEYADGIVLVVTANSTRREAAREARDRIAASRLQVLGVVLDERTFPIPEAIYSRL